MTKPVIINAIGLACPMPVMEVRKSLASTTSLVFEVLVDNDSAAENVSRMARNAGCEVAFQDLDDGTYKLVLTRSEASTTNVKEEIPAVSCATTNQSVVLVASDSVGRGSEELGKILMIGLINTLGQLDTLPSHVLLMNAGVRLTVDGSEVLESLGDLEKRGVQLLVCGTCLDFFHLKEARQVGQVSNMFDILSVLAEAGRVIRP